MNETEKTRILIQGIDADIKARFKAWCDLNGIPMYKKIEEMMDECSKTLKTPTKKVKP